MAILEKDFKVKVKAFLKTLPNCWHVKIQQVAIAGTPDILCCINGYFVALELKRSEKAKVSALQSHTIHLIMKAGGYAWTLYPENFEEVKQDLIKLSNKGATTCQ